MPNKTNHNVDDLECNYKSMFKSEADREAFYLMFKQQCIFKSECTIDIENMLVNMTDSKDFEKGKTEEFQTFKLSQMITDKCY